MNILIDARPLCIRSPGGVTRVAKQLLDELFALEQPHSFFLGTTGATRPLLPWQESPQRIHLHRTIPNKVASTLTATGLSSFDRFFHRANADHLLLLNIGHVGRPRLPYTLLVHDLTFLTEPRWYSAHARLWHPVVHARRLIQEATTLLTLTQYVRSDLESQLHIPSSRIQQLPFFPTLVGTPAELPEQLRGKQFLFGLGHGDRRKNAEATIQAWRVLRQEPEWKELALVLTTREPIPPPSEPGLSFIPFPSDELVSALYKHAAVFVYPSWSEGYGVPLQEAARFGTPCIASSGSALEETAPTGTLFTPPEKPHLLVAALRAHLLAPKQSAQREIPPSNQSAGRTLLQYLTGK